MLANICRLLVSLVLCVHNCRSQEQQKLMWQFPKAVAEPQSLQAKFELSEGPSHPSPTLVQLVPSLCAYVLVWLGMLYYFRFNCEGASLSGMQLDLVGQAYRISFKKNKLSSGITHNALYWA